VRRRAQLAASAAIAACAMIGAAAAAPVFSIQTPGPLASLDGGLVAASAASPSDAWAVGASLMAHWNGETWASVAPPLGGTQLSDVTEIASNDVWAVGNTSAQTVAQHWNGTNWSVISTPTPGANPSFSSITSIASNDVWIAGHQISPLNGSAIVPLFEHWDGKAWTVVPSPEPNPDGFYFVSKISADTSSDVWAVGQNGSGPSATAFSYHWNGAAWSQVRTPSPGKGAVLGGVVALSPTNAWAVGSFGAEPTIKIKHQAISGNPIQTLIEHWDGSAWQVTASPNFGPTALNQSNHLMGVVALSPTDLWAVGRAFIPDGSNSQISFALHGDGTSWTVQPTPDVGGNNTLFGAAVAAPSTVWFVGGGNFPNLISGVGPLIAGTSGG
jgi:hypothetical protein